MHAIESEKLALLIPFTVVILGAIVGVVAIITYNKRKERETEMQLSLKAQMLERGMSAEEIERVIEAGQQVPVSKQVARGLNRWANQR